LNTRLNPKPDSLLSAQNKLENEAHPYVWFPPNSSHSILSRTSSAYGYCFDKLRCPQMGAKLKGRKWAGSEKSAFRAAGSTGYTKLYKNPKEDKHHR
jgi:hypothetical protein